MQFFSRESCSFVDPGVPASPASMEETGMTGSGVFEWIVVQSQIATLRSQ
ncbi:MAG: hypothetical protein KAH38_08625 [Candidatus Hydrogenedentes bacterium]|nr:hypothetical protein [Candidatus Hydrogenedentota bacterium]